MWLHVATQKKSVWCHEYSSFLMHVLGSTLGLPFVYFMHDKFPETKMYMWIEWHISQKNQELRKSTKKQDKPGKSSKSHFGCCFCHKTAKLAILDALNLTGKSILAIFQKTEIQTFQNCQKLKIQRFKIPKLAKIEGENGPKSQKCQKTEGQNG